MKTIPKIFKTLIAALLLLFVVGCSNDDDTPPPTGTPLDIVGYASETSELSNLVAAIEQAGLASTLQGEGPFTVFAPNNAAFESFLSANGFASLDAVPDDILTEILLNHVVSGQFNDNDLTTGYTSSLATGAADLNLSLYVNTTDGVKINGSNVILANRQATNGTVHIVDAVIGLPTPVTFATTNPDLSLLAEALTTATPDTDFITTLSGDGPFTIFAPTNEAFEELLGRLDGFDSLDDFNTAQLQTFLTTILQYHVVSGAAVPSGDLTDEQVISTLVLEGEDVTIGIDGEAVTIIDDDIAQPANVVIADIVASNAIVHAIDKVLLPQAIIDALDGVLYSTITDIAIATPTLSNLVAALIAADGELPTVLRGEGPFTVFAPTDSAFEAFLEANEFDGLSDVPVEVLTQVLLNHVVSGTNFSDELMTGYVNTLSTAGPSEVALSMFINTSDGVVLNGGLDNSGATVTAADVRASNGVVHIVDGVIGLPNIVNHAVANPDFSTLVTALTTLTPSTDFVGILSRSEGENEDEIDPPFTVFAPTNAAFAALSPIPMEETLTQVLLHHVVAGANVQSSDLTPDGETTATTLENDDITITLPGTGDNIADIEDGSGNDDIGIIAVDVQSTNGVIHALNKVMIPNTTNNNN